MSSAPLWWWTAPGLAGQSLPPAHGRVVGESLIAHVNATTQGKTCHASKASAEDPELRYKACLIFQTCFWREWLWGAGYWGWTLSPAGKFLWVMFTVGLHTVCQYYLLNQSLYPVSSHVFFLACSPKTNLQKQKQRWDDSENSKAKKLQSYSWNQF